MVTVALQFTYHIDIISVPDEIGLKIRKYQKLFDKWLYDKNNDHGNWIKKNGKPVAVSFDTDTFIDYLNAYHINSPNQKAFVVERESNDISQTISMLYF